MEKIKRIWFAGNRIFMADENAMEYSRPLQAFPRLLCATERQREDFRISRWEDSVRWEAIDEDIHISSFLETTEPDYDNAVFRLVKDYSPSLHKELASFLHIDISLLYKYYHGISQAPSTTIDGIMRWKEQLSSKIA